MHSRSLASICLITASIGLIAGCGDHATSTGSRGQSQTAKISQLSEEVGETMRELLEVEFIPVVLRIERLVMGKVRELSNRTEASGLGTAQIGFTRNGDGLVVTEKGTNLITTYAVGPDGLTSACGEAPVTQALRVLRSGALRADKHLPA